MLNPLSSEALLENALFMDRCGEGEAVITRLEKALRIAEDQKKVKEARDVSINNLLLSLKMCYYRVTVGWPRYISDSMQQQQEGKIYRH
ncbi:hypothetical protein F0562_034460 [Nyssa sinensis]|uniref:Uncharacterized protein n=1 Tax=Nyssa sinensis TaxID=561372 RepID=A0A5J5AJP6_9ASTE|nr:hypothetical protein F0562_034460 [Nyssa sinensis]